MLIQTLLSHGKQSKRHARSYYYENVQVRASGTVDRQAVSGSIATANNTLQAASPPDMSSIRGVQKGELRFCRLAPTGVVRDAKATLATPPWGEREGTSSCRLQHLEWRTRYLAPASREALAVI